MATFPNKSMETWIMIKLDSWVRFFPFRCIRNGKILPIKLKIFHHVLNMRVSLALIEEADIIDLMRIHSGIGHELDRRRAATVFSWIMETAY